uniref:Uncharacterized protein n=1 Tax=viral metagenome TaxID=1070528 RepID=A0A6C0BD21_9ZZZZ
MSFLIQGGDKIFQSIQPVNVAIDRFHYIDAIFNLCLGGDSNINSPIIKVGFINSGLNVLDRMFVCEETQSMLIFVKNVTLKTKPSEFIRTAYIVVRSAVSYFHFSTGYIFSDLFDYCLIEREDALANLIFFYNNTAYDDILKISSIDPDYKIKTRVFLKYNNYEIGNNLFIYSYVFRSSIQYKIGYYLEERNWKYFHPMIAIARNFGELPNSMQFLQALLSNIRYTSNLISIQLNSIADNDDKKGRKKRYTGMSLLDKVNQSTTVQEKKISIGWFLAEIMYRFFYAD